MAAGSSAARAGRGAHAWRRSKPQAVAQQTALLDFYVEYTLVVCLEQAHLRALVLDALHANIQDAFNEHGVQIMSPHYEMDPISTEKWYRKSAGNRWFGHEMSTLATPSEY